MTAKKAHWGGESFLFSSHAPEKHIDVFLGNVGVGAVTTPGQLSGGVERDCAQLIFH
jgi:hypothetical protein